MFHDFPPFTDRYSVIEEFVLHAPTHPIIPPKKKKKKKKKNQYLRLVLEDQVLIYSSHFNEYKCVKKL